MYKKGGHTMDTIIKIVIILFIIIYLLSPVDACPGPVDDLIVLLLGAASAKSLSD